MSQLGGQKVPNYVICPCQHCGGNIEFDANELDASEIPTVPCPHCELQTIIFVPDQKEATAISDKNLPGSVKSSNASHIAKILLSAQQGDKEAQFSMGMLYYCGVDIPRSFTEAVSWWLKSAEQGHADAQFGLGYAYKDGTGVQRDYPEAIRWLSLSATQGNSYAQFVLGTTYLNGEGSPKNTIEAIKWFRKSAEQGHPEAQLSLGKAYCKGNGVPKI
jgi:TPR repeat protein